MDYCRSLRILANSHLIKASQKKKLGMTLKRISPEPIEDPNLEELELNAQGGPGGIPFSAFSKWTFFSLRKIQYLSAIPIGLYFPLHGINTLVVPTISADSAPDEVLMMIRELLPPLTTKILVTSIFLHFGSGLVIRMWNWIKNYDSKTKNAGGEVPFPLERRSEQVSQRNIGLIGGLSGYFIGLNKRFRISPQILSGYILAPFLTYHLYVMKFIPEAVKTDVDFNYIKWILQNSRWQVKWLGGIIPLVLLIVSGTYHILAGTCQYMAVEKLSKRRKWSNLITALMASGIFGLYKLSKQVTLFVDSQKYEKVLHYFL